MIIIIRIRNRLKYKRKILKRKNIEFPLKTKLRKKLVDLPSTYGSDKASKSFSI